VIEAYRKKLWRLEPSRKVMTESECARFLREVGFCLIFGSDNISLPKIYDSSGETDDWWHWKDTLQAKKKAYLARLFAKKATLVSMEMLPACLSRYFHGGGHLVADEEHFYGLLSHGAKRIADYLEAQGPTPADEIRKALFKKGPEGTRRFHAHLLELQTKFKVVTVGLREGPSWGTRILGLFSDWIPGEVVKQAESLSAQEAHERVIERFLRTAGAIPMKEWRRHFGDSEENRAALECLGRQGILFTGRFGKKEWILHRTYYNHHEK